MTELSFLVYVPNEGFENRPCASISPLRNHSKPSYTYGTPQFPETSDPTLLTGLYKAFRNLARDKYLSTKTSLVSPPIHASEL